MNFEMTVMFFKTDYIPQSFVLFIPEPAMRVLCGKDDFPAVTLIVRSSLLAFFSLISCAVLDLIHPLKFSLSSWELFLLL